MSGARTLQRLLDSSVARYPDHTAVEDPDRASVTYAELGRLSDDVRDRLHHLGVRPGDRVGIYLRKSIDAVAAIYGALKAGAAYVPVDPEAPQERCAYVLNNCTVRALICDRALAEALEPELARLGELPALLRVQAEEGAVPLAAALEREQRRDPAPRVETVRGQPDDLAYILYTSGSTGRPKGVMLTQRNALSFVDWCSDTFEPAPADVFSSHAPLHFDLSIFDLYVCLKHGAKLVLIGEQIGKDPLRLAPLIAERGITIWYSTPSILALLANYGKLERYPWGALRLVLFAGEVFPIPQLRLLRSRWPEPRFYNLYGPTETNVCTCHEVPAEIPAECVDPFPIGRICPPNRGRVIDPDGRTVPRGREGELVVCGANVMVGYWNLPENNRAAFVEDDAGERWYRTGDLVVEEGDGVYRYRGRRDRMVKRRGYRVELGEVEAGLARHPTVREVAVVATDDPAAGVRIRAFLSTRDGSTPSIIHLKEFSSHALPRYMVPDVFTVVDALPRTSTDKVDYQSLARLG